MNRLISVVTSFHSEAHKEKINAAAEKLGFTVLPGAEVRFDKSPYGINDFLVYGCDEELFLTAPRLNELTSLEELKAILPEDACVVLAHPFRVKMTVVDPAPLFGIEAHNGLTEPFRNGMAEAYAEFYGKAMTSGSDCHKTYQIGNGGILCETLPETEAELIALLRSGNYKLI